MRKSLIALTAAVAAFAFTASAAEARGRGFGVGLGVGLLLGGAIAHHHHHRPRTYVTTPQPVYVPRQAQAQQPAAPAVLTADDLGRYYDAASKTWFDGRDRCWTGAQAWTFRGGSWFYGPAAWYESNGSWMVRTGAAPTQVDCASNPAIMARMPKANVDRTAGATSPAADRQTSAATVAAEGPSAGQRIADGLEGTPAAASLSTE